MKKYILEACVDSPESAVEAAGGGADRLELCANLIIGGTTPEQALYEKVRELTDTRIHVLIRPRYGDFLYTEHEFGIILRSVELYRRLGAEGVVVGCLLPDGSLDTERMKALREAAGDMSMTLHRAFDMCADPYEALEQAKGLGVQTILTSGQKADCTQGREPADDSRHGSVQLPYVGEDGAGQRHGLPEGGGVHGRAGAGGVRNFPHCPGEDPCGQAGAGRGFTAANLTSKKEWRKKGC